MRVLAVCTGSAQPIRAKSGRTGHYKTPQAGAVTVGVTGLHSDTIVDTAHHGGPEQAVYVVGEADRIWWEQILKRPLPAGFFGENLLIDDLACADLALGDVLEAGDVTLQITAPRIPCVTWNVRIGDPRGVKMFNDAARPGAYARVLRKGAVTAFDPVVHIPFDGARVSIPDHFERYVNDRMDAAYFRLLLRIPCHAAIHEMARNHLERTT